MYTLGGFLDTARRILEEELARRRAAGMEDPYEGIRGPAEWGLQPPLQDEPVTLAPIEVEVPRAGIPGGTLGLLLALGVAGALLGRTLR